MGGGVLTLLSVLLVGITDARADCPDIDVTLSTAEDDTLSFFLADAQKALDQVVEGLGCSGSIVTPTQVTRYWQTQALLWSFQEDSRADAAFASSKLGEPTRWESDFGDEAKARWAAAEPADGPAIPLVLKGAGDAEQVWIDGKLVAAREAPPGYHLVQVGGQNPRYARSVEVPTTGELVLSVPPPDPAAAPEPEPVVEPEPVPEPVVGPEPVPEPVSEPVVEPEPEPEPQPAPVQGPVARADLVPPLTGLGGGLADADGRAVSWRQDVLPLARTQASGRRSLRRMPLNTVGQVTALGVAAGGVYGTYLFGWELTTGRSYPQGPVLAGTVGSAVVALSGITTRFLLAGKRRKHKKTIRDAANTALQKGN